MKRVYIRVDAYFDIGFGHLKRCLVIADFLKTKGIIPTFILGGDKVTQVQIQEAKFECKRIPIQLSFSEQSQNLDEYINKNASCIVVDIAHSNALKDIHGLSNYFDCLSSRGSLVVIDSLGEQSLRKNIKELTCDLLVSPYIGENNLKHRVPYKFLSGIKYFVLNPIYRIKNQRKIVKDANKILITCGGSDPKSISKEILEITEVINNKSLEIKLVVGPGFTFEANKELVKISKTSFHEITLINSPENLLELMLWCDIAISASGLTKYELAATGTPVILVSIDSAHDNMNKSFTETGYAKDMGVVENISKKNFADCIMKLLEDANERKHQSRLGKKLVDGRGVKRLVNEIMRNFDAES